MFKHKFSFILPLILILPVIIWYLLKVDPNILLGGEGNYFLDYSNYNKNFISMWSHWGLGHNQIFLNGINFITLLFSYINDPRINSFIIFSIFYICPFLLFYNFSRLLTKDLYKRSLSSVFYSFSPFAVSFISQHNIWNNSILILIPIYLYLIFRFFNNSYLLISILTFSFYLFNFIGNPPIFVILIMIVNFGYIYKSIDSKIHLKKTILHLFLINSSYALVNLHIVLSFIFGDSNIGGIYDSSSAIGWLYSTTFNDLEKFGKVILGIQHFGSPDFDDFSKYYTFPLSKIFLLAFITYILFCSLKYKSSVKIKYLVLVYLISLFLSKGVALPGGIIYKFLFDYIPFFNIFKTPTEKFYILVNLFFSLLIILVFPNISEIKSKFSKLLLITPFIFFIFPIYMGYILSSHFSVGNEVSRIYSDYNEDLEIVNFIDNNYKDSAIIYVPGHNNYQVWKQNINSDNTYSGMDPVQHNLKNNHYIDIALNRDLYDSMVNNNIQRFLYLSELYNVKLLYFNDNHLYPFGTKLPVNTLMNFIAQTDFELVYDKDGYHLYEIKNLTNNSNLMSIDSYLKVYESNFDNDKSLEDTELKKDLHILEVQMDVNRLKENQFTVPSEGSLDISFVNFNDRFYTSRLEKLSYLEDFQYRLRPNEMIIDIINQDFFTWDSLKLNNFDFNNEFTLSSNGLQFRLKESVENKNSSYNELFSNTVENFITPRSSSKYIMERELDLKSSDGWVYNTKNNRVWIRNRNFPQNINFDTISIEFSNTNFNLFTEMFTRSSLKFKKKSVSIFSPINRHKVFRFQDLPSFYKINNNNIVFNFLIPRSLSTQYYIDEMILSSFKSNFFLEDQKNQINIDPNILSLKKVSLLKMYSDTTDNTLWYVRQKNTNNVIIDLSILNSFENILNQTPVDPIKDIKFMANSEILTKNLLVFKKNKNKNTKIDKAQILKKTIKILKKDKNLNQELSTTEISIIKDLKAFIYSKIDKQVSDTSSLSDLDLFKQNLYIIEELPEEERLIDKIKIIENALKIVSEKKNLEDELELYELRILLDLPFKSKKKSLKLVAKEQHDFQYELGNSFSDYTDYYKNLSTNSRYNFIKNTVENDFTDKKIIIDDFCYLFNSFNIQKTSLSKLALSLEKIQCDSNENDSFEFDDKYTLIKLLTWIDNGSITIDFQEKEDYTESKKLKINFSLILELTLILAIGFYFKSINKVHTYFINLELQTKFMYLFIFTSLFVLINSKIILIFLPLLLVNYIRLFFFKKL